MSPSPPARAMSLSAPARAAGTGRSPLHPELRDQLAIWINDERPGWPRADTNPALFLNARGGRLGVRGASDILARLAEDAGIDADDFTIHFLRHTLVTTIVRGGHDIVLWAYYLGIQR